jgi:hypothetical protein
VLRGGDGELREEGGDGGVAAEEVGEEAFAVAGAHARGGAGAGEGEAVVDGRYVRQGVADVDDEAGEGAGGVELGHGTVEDAEGGDVEALEEDLARALVGFAGETGEEGEEDWRLVLDAAELEAREEDVFPVCVEPPPNSGGAMVNKKNKTTIRPRRGRVENPREGDKTYQRASACIKSLI